MDHRIDPVAGTINSFVVQPRSPLNRTSPACRLSVIARRAGPLAIKAIGPEPRRVRLAGGSWSGSSSRVAAESRPVALFLSPADCEAALSVTRTDGSTRVDGLTAPPHSPACRADWRQPYGDGRRVRRPSVQSPSTSTTWPRRRSSLTVAAGIRPSTTSTPGRASRGQNDGGKCSECQACASIDSCKFMPSAHGAAKNARSNDPAGRRRGCPRRDKARRRATPWWARTWVAEVVANAGLYDLVQYTIDV